MANSVPGQIRLMQTEDDVTKSSPATAGLTGPPSASPRRAPPRATPRYLRNAALWYLARYASSAAHLRRLLLVKVERSVRAHGTDRSRGAAEVARLIEKFLDRGLLDDGRYAEGRARALFRRGGSARAIRAALARKGVAKDLIERGLAALRDEASEPELAAALVYARRRGLGPFRREEERALRRARDLAALVRRGFAHDLARRVIDTRDPTAPGAEAGIPGPRNKAVTSGGDSGSLTAD